jgi:hypothetical protein
VFVARACGTIPSLRCSICMQLESVDLTWPNIPAFHLITSTSQLLEASTPPSLLFSGDAIEFVQRSMIFTDCPLQRSDHEKRKLNS